MPGHLVTRIKKETRMRVLDREVVSLPGSYNEAPDGPGLRDKEGGGCGFIEPLQCVRPRGKLPGTCSSQDRRSIRQR